MLRSSKNFIEAAVQLKQLYRNRRTVQQWKPDLQEKAGFPCLKLKQPGCLQRVRTQLRIKKEKNRNSCCIDSTYMVQHFCFVKMHAFYFSFLHSTSSFNQVISKINFYSPRIQEWNFYDFKAIKSSLKKFFFNFLGSPCHLSQWGCNVDDCGLTLRDTSPQKLCQICASL